MLEKARLWMATKILPPQISAVNVSLVGALKNIIVDNTTLFKMSATFSAIRLISESMGCMSLKMYERKGNTRARVREHNLIQLLDNKPNAEQTGNEFIEALTVGICAGQSYSTIDRLGNRIIAITPYPKSRIKINLNSDKTDYDYKIKMVTGEVEKSKDDVLAIRGFGDGINLEGFDISKYHAQAFAVAIAADSFASDYFNRGARPLGYLKTPETLKSADREAYSKSFGATVNESIESGRLPLLERGIEFVAVSSNGADANVSEAKKNAIADVARIYRIPLHLLMESVGMTYNNVEQQNIHFLQFTLNPYIVRIQNRLNLLLPIAERDRFYLEFDPSSLLRGDSQTRGNYYRQMVLAGIYTQNEIRGWENLPPLEGGDVLLSPLNMTPSELLGQENANSNTTNRN